MPGSPYTSLPKLPGSANTGSSDPVLKLLAPDGLVDDEPNIPVMPMGFQNAAPASPYSSLPPIGGSPPSAYSKLPPSPSAPGAAPANTYSTLPPSPSAPGAAPANTYSTLPPSPSAPGAAPANTYSTLPTLPAVPGSGAFQPGAYSTLPTPSSPPGMPSLPGAPSVPAQGNAPAWSFPAKTPDINKVSIMGNLRVLKASMVIDPPAVKKFLDDLQRAKYRVEIGHTLRRRWQIFDTGEVKGHFVQKDASKVGFASLGTSKSGKDFEYPQDWAYKSMIWVCIPNEADRPTIYSHVGKPHRFHHSSIAGATEVIGAGEWIVIKGKLRKISANSGHYRPTLDMLYHSVLHMAGAFQPNTTVFLYDSKADKWIDYPVLSFIRSPSNGGQYWVHPQSPLV